MQDIVESAVQQTRKTGGKRVAPYHLYVVSLTDRKRAALETETFDFLKDIVDKVADPLDSGAAPRTAKRRKVPKADDAVPDAEAPAAPAADSTTPTAETAPAADTTPTADAAPAADVPAALEPKHEADASMPLQYTKPMISVASLVSDTNSPAYMHETSPKTDPDTAEADVAPAAEEPAPTAGAAPKAEADDSLEAHAPLKAEV